MGLLDDAIREHLELKRRTGADATDVARDEREALGRGEPIAPEPAPEAQHYADPAVGDDDVGPVFYDDEPDDYVEQPPYATPTPASAPMTAPPPPPPPTPGQAGPPSAPSPGPQTEEYRIPPEEPEPTDVLEQTPDFLQETPEHDRLWFEQAPPQEFDFDK